MLHDKNVLLIENYLTQTADKFLQWGYYSQAKGAIPIDTEVKLSKWSVKPDRCPSQASREKKQEIYMSIRRS